MKYVLIGVGVLVVLELVVGVGVAAYLTRAFSGAIPTPKPPAGGADGPVMTPDAGTYSATA